MADHGIALMKMRERAELLQWSEASSKGNAPLFAALYRQIAADDDLFALSLEAAPEQLSGRLLISAVHYMLLRSPDQPLAAYFPSITADPLPASDVGPHFQAFCRDNRHELTNTIATRTLQTTSPERAPQLLLALDHVSRAIGKPFSLVEVGCSAGLLLLFDHYRYQLPNGQSLGDAAAEVVISPFEMVAERGSIPSKLPQIRQRVGLDLNPVDVTDPDARRWILGCSSADRVQKFNSLRTALEYRAGIPLNIIPGDAMETVPAALQDISGPVCVYHSRCLYQWPRAAQQAFSLMLKRLSQWRTIHRVGIEWNGVQSDPLGLAGRGQNEINHTVYHDGQSETQLLARVPGKSRIEWLA
jgi:hypothetical protein